MRLEPGDLYEKLEFDKILSLLEEACFGEQGKEQIRAIQPMSNLAHIEQGLDEVDEFRRSLEKRDNFPIGAYQEINEELRMLEIAGFVLPEDGLQKLNILLLFIKEIYKFFNKDRQEAYETLYNIIRPIHFNEDLLHAIEGVIDEEGNIRPDASAELQKIRRHIQSKYREMDRQFRLIIDTYRKKGWLTDNVESFRNARRVLSVPSEHKRKIRGIIHDESSTGRTAFIEPEGVIDINNDLFDLQQEEKREIYRILKELSATLRPYLPSLHDYQNLIIRFDVVQTKAQLALKLNAVRPRTKKQPTLAIIKGRHPLLYLKNKGLGRKTIPFDLSLFGQNRILVLSGPNAGGKSITMKSVGLLQLMFQCGLLLPVDGQTEMAVFEQLFADIGDQQSLENDLSTYSSRLENAKVFLEHANPDTLVLIDEFGSGTDPKIGGAIAESVLFELNRRKIYGVITTHYSNLKVFAFKTRGLVNGSMHFDKDNLSPSYELQVGRPGSSYAFEIAGKSGLPGRVLKYARKRIGSNERAVDDLLVDLQREKQEVEERLNELTDKQKLLDRLTKTYDQLHRDLEYKRKKHKLERKEQELQQSAQENKELERLIRELKEEKNLDKAKKVSLEIKYQRENLSEQVGGLREEIYHPDQALFEDRPLAVGDFVKLKTGGATGEIESIDRKNAIMIMGGMRMTVKLRDLQLAKTPLDVKTTQSVHSDIDYAARFDSKIDIRGMRYVEAMKVIEDFVDQALLADVSNLRIVHGKGNGSLRDAVKKKLREYNVTMEVYHPAAEAGGDGVTLVDL
ncbi:MAG: endonuclease MutS2 [Lewinella sp.]|jgi:DNA mismatch repair protein MutS2|uniref:endonuclease MutS2 n=1 Tax=Lewinella sp. TaxID=2004506 RepID=UPI003D6BDF1A